jgi:hypothetical protein
MPFYIVKFAGSAPDPKQRKALNDARIVYDGVSTAEGLGIPVHRILVEASDSVDALAKAKEALGPQEGRRWIDALRASEDADHHPDE